MPITDDSLTEDPETLTLSLSQPGWATLGDAVATGTIEDDETEETAANSEPTGLPTISGTPEEDQTLTADTSAIADADGPAEITFTHQWLAGGTNITGATGSTLFLTSSEQGQTIQLRVSFTDSAGTVETLTSAATLPVARRVSPTVWQADMLVVQYTESTIGAASADLFSNVGGTAELQIRSLWSSVPDRDLRLAFTTGLADADSMTLEAGDLSLPFPAGSSGNGSFKWTNLDVDWQDGETIAVRIVPTTAPVIVTTNTPPTGLPTITGTPNAGQELTADRSAIQDADGLTNVSYSYQWIANDGTSDAEIQDATNSKYTASANDVGKTIKVRVSFTDDAGNDESLTSVATLVVAAIAPTAPLDLTAAPGAQPETLDVAWNAPSSDGGSDITGYTVEWKLTTGSWDTPADVSQTTVTGTGHTITGLTGDVEYTVRVLATNNAGNGPLSTDAAATPAAVPEEPPEPVNNAPTGLPTISGTPQVDETLTADTSGISDEDGLANVSYQYQWLRDDADIAGQTNSTYRLVSADQDKTIKVRVTFRDNADNAESLTSVATTAVAAQPTSLLTASFANVPADHNGSNFTFQLSFSENVEAGYARIRDHAFTVTGATIASASRITQGSNQGWNVEVNPTGNGSVTITLPETTDCNASGAICTDDERKLSHATSEIVAGPPAISVSDANVQEAEGAVLEFSVTLSHLSSRTVTVAYATSDGSAQAGSDYTAKTGTLTFNAGDTSQTVQVTVLTDSEDESQETLTLTLSNPSQATLDDGTGTGTIENGESSSGTQEDPPAETPVVLLTASFGNMPATHNGSAFTFDLSFSENVKAGYARIRDDALTISGGKIANAQRKTQGSNQNWTITVKPDGNDAITITLPETSNCDTTGAICTYDGRKLSGSTSTQVTGPA